ncbi:MAG: hypothetical protein U5J78_02550 [Parasphingorhabdus sp.]|nr:hypothetical protein [Parasphingorhabdus sp.]
MSIARTDQAKNPALILDRFDSMTPDRIYQATTQWLSLHFWEILIAAVIGTAIFLAFGGLKRLAKRQLARNDGMVGFRTTFLRAAARTSRLFMLAVSARLVIAYANAPELVASTIGFFFTIMSVWQVAIWAREIILGLIERRTMLDDRSETLENAMTLIRILVSFAVFAIAAIVILDNLGFNVTGLIAGLGVGGICNLASLRRAFSLICLPRCRSFSTSRSNAAKRSHSTILPELSRKSV